MRREEIQLLARARSGDVAATLDVGRRYLLGVEGFPRHLATGLEYLRGPAVCDSIESSVLIAESLPLQDILALDQFPALHRAVTAGSAAAMIKLGAWHAANGRPANDAAAMFERSCELKDHPQARAALRASRGGSASWRALVLKALDGSDWLDASAVVALAVRAAMHDDDTERLWVGLDIMRRLSEVVSDELASLVVAAVTRSERQRHRTVGLPAETIENCLDACAGRNDVQAAYVLGRALCGIAVGELAPAAIARSANMRKGAALLLRAADGGCVAAWAHLHHVHATHTSSVANAQLARFFLEKAALSGDTMSQRKLGVTILKSASRIEETEQGVLWLSAAADAGDSDAQDLLDSFVIPVRGDDATAQDAIEMLRGNDPLLACRLRLARAFGLTKLEALSVDPVAGARPWGLLVGPNAFVRQTRLASPRAIPARSDEARSALRVAVAFFHQFQSNGGPYEGDMRKRSVRLRRALAWHDLDEAMFFARASTTALDKLRIGSKWAYYRLRHSHHDALAI